MSVWGDDYEAAALFWGRNPANLLDGLISRSDDNERDRDDWSRVDFPPSRMKMGAEDIFASPFLFSSHSLKGPSFFIISHYTLFSSSVARE